MEKGIIIVFIVILLLVLVALIVSFFLIRRNINTVLEDKNLCADVVCPSGKPATLDDS